MDYTNKDDKSKGTGKLKEIKNVKINETEKIIFDQTPLIKELIAINVGYIYDDEYLEGKLYRIFGDYKAKQLTPLGTSTDGTYLYVCNTDNHQIQMLHPNGDLYKCFESKENKWPKFLVIHQSEIYVRG